MDEATKQRVVEELEQLTTRTERLAAFVGGAKFVALPIEDQVDLSKQLVLMEAYRDVLKRRHDRHA